MLQGITCVTALLDLQQNTLKTSKKKKGIHLQGKQAFKLHANSHPDPELT